MMSEKKITEDLLKSTIEDLENIEKYIQEFSNFLPLAVCTVNPLRTVIVTNLAFQTLTGYEEVEMIGKRIEDLFLNKKDFKNLIQKKIFKKKPGLTQKMILLTKSKRKITVNMAISARRDEKNNFIGYFIALSDITKFENLKQSLEERVKKRTKDLEMRTREITESRTALMNVLEDVEDARSAAEEEKDKTLTIITNFADGLLVFDTENKLSLINPQAEDFFGIKTEKIVEKSVLELTTIPNLRPLIDLLGKEIKGVYRKELLIKENLTLEVSVISMISREEKLGTLVVLHDVTRGKMIERIKTEFVSLSAHQLRTPLSAIKWTLKMLLDGDLGKITKEQKEYIEKTYQSNERMIRLINDLLNVARIEEGRFLYNVKGRNIIEIAEQVIVSSKEVAQRKGLRFKFQKPSKKIPDLELDSEKISIAFQNLIDNAINYTNPGGFIEVSIEYLEDKREILVSVKDTGIGIPRGQQKRVFTRFFRAANAMKTETEGTGLGLFIAKNIIEAHGGKIWFKSKENEGTTFYFALPVLR